MSEFLITVIMPTYNSEKTIEYSLKSIRNQRINQEQIEILVVDGGSTDNTIKIAQQYGARIIINERRLPEFAKQKGMLEARGVYAMFLDSDESFVNMDSFQRRIQSLDEHKVVKNLVSTGQVCQENENGVTHYANFIGDPFSNFVYRYNGYNRVEDLIKQYKHKKIKHGFCLDFTESKYLPLFDALGNMFEVDTALELYKLGSEDKSFVANIFSNMVQNTHKAIVMEDDFICHRSNLTKKIYLNKLKWRVKNNLFQTEGVGFAQRNQKEQGLTIRKLLFIPYCVFIIPVLWDAIYFSIKNKNIYFLNHIWYTEYTFITIVWYVALKLLHIPVKMDETYGKKVIN